MEFEDAKKAEKQWMEETLNLFKSGFTIIELVSFEEQRIERQLSSALEVLGVPFYSYSSSENIFKIFGEVEKTEGGAVFLIKDIHPYFDRPKVVRKIRDLIPRLHNQGQCIVFLTPLESAPVELSKDIVIVDVPLPSAETIGGSITTVYSDVTIPVSEKSLREVGEALKGLTMEEAMKVLRKLLLVHGPKALSNLPLVLNEKKMLLRAGRLLLPVEPQESIEDLGGASELKKWLWERERGFSPEARDFGLPTPRGLMLVGVQGCGKSLSAKVVASTWGMPLWRLELPLILGEQYPEARLHESLKTMDALAPAILWIDEIEKVFQTELKGISSRILGSFITWLSEKNSAVFVVATANEVDYLPPELVRKGRFDEIFFFDLPTVHEREEILRIHLRNRGQETGNFDLESLAVRTEYFSGSEIEQAIISALYRAFSAGRSLNQRDIEIAIDDTVPLYRTYEEKIKALRQWAKGRARAASMESKRMDFFSER